MKEKVAKKLAKKGKTIRQVAVLPFRRTEEGGVEILVLTSRETRRFVLPKGWPMRGLPDWKAAALEAKQEAGLIGAVDPRPIGGYDYWKRLPSVFVHVSVAVFALEVKGQRPKFREMGVRQMQWLEAGHAAALVDEPALGALIARFAGELGARGEDEASPG